MIFSSKRQSVPARPSSDRAKNLELLRGSPLFDASWYERLNPDLSERGIDLVEHFLDYGGGEGRWPHPLFHSDFYLQSYPDVRDAGINPLVHYIRAGFAEDRDPNPLFNAAWYRDRHLAGSAAAASALQHYLDHPLNPTSEIFDAGWYATTYLEDLPSVVPLMHYFSIGRAAGMLPNAAVVPDPENSAFELLASGLFDPALYDRLNPDVAASRTDPFVHYMTRGFREGRTPHPLFDVTCYGRQHPACADGDVNPLLHFLREGANADLNPNYYFDTGWYKATYPECVERGQNPLTHFIAEGGLRTNPSLRFDAVWYRGRHPDVAKHGQNPLIHYVLSGMDEGRAIRAVADGLFREDDTLAARIVQLKRTARRGRRTVLFVTHAPLGRLKGHVPALVEAYVSLDCDVVLIVAADQRRTSIPDDTLKLCTSVYVRENRGFDFAAWAHVIRLDDDLLLSDPLIFINDSLVGPIGSGRLRAILDRVDASQADVVGLTDNIFRAWHLQSFFLAFKPGALSSYAFHAYLDAIVNLRDKDQVITFYELTLSAYLKASGLRMEALFPMRREREFVGNRMIFEWRDLIDEGVPFIKASLLVGEHRELGGQAVRIALADRGFDLALIEPTHHHEGAKVWVDLDAAASASKPVGDRVAFIGPTSLSNGLGMASRGYVRALHGTRFSLDVRPLQTPFHVHRRLSPEWQARSFAGAADVALVHINGDGWDQLLTPSQRDQIATARWKVGLFVWESSFVPANWLPTIDGLDAIWAPSEFCADIFRRITPAPVDVVPYVVENEGEEPLDDGARDELCRAFALDADRRHILYAFDGSSFLARKNPQALVRAFRQSGLARRGWQLVLKTKHVFDIPVEGRTLMELVGTDGDVVVIDRPMSQGDLARLFAACPIYASSHASEGFGLTIAEAMEMGKVVVATDYGGSRDFLDASCGFPVPATEVTLERSLGPYLRGSTWGSVDEAALAEALAMASAAVDDGRAAAIGGAARRRVRDRLSTVAVARAMTASLDRLMARDGR